MKPKIFNLAVAIPHTGTVITDLALCLTQMALALSKHPIPGYQGIGMAIMAKKTSILPKSRQELVEEAIAAKCTHLLFIDSDQTFPGSLVHRLARHNKPVIGCNIATKCLPSDPTARNFNPKWHGGDVVYSQGKRGIEQVWRIGCGILLLDLSIFAAIPKPWFSIEYNTERADFVGEDWYLCEKLQAAGIPIYVDHDVSLEIGHTGAYTFEHKDIVPRQLHHEGVK